MKNKISTLLIACIVVGMTGCVQTPLDYKTGMEVSAEVLQDFVAGETTQATVVGKLGQPNRKVAINTKEVWYFDFTRIGVLSGNISEATVFEWDNNGTLLSFYKTGKAGKSGNPLIDAANGN